MNTRYLMIYLASCAMHGEIPDKRKIESVDIEKLFDICKFHSIAGLVAYALESAGIKDEKFEKEKSLVIRNTILLDSERKKIFEFFEKEKIWYMPLKGVYLKELYPKIGMRQMCDNDILIDMSKIGVVDEFMKNRGYTMDKSEESHDWAYQKPVCYNYEMHKTLVGDYHNKVWYDYYLNVKDRLVKDEGNDYGFHFTNEDFYIYMRLHEYKHFSVSGIGIRSLIDVYVFLNRYEKELDWKYIEAECRKLGIADFEQQTRKLAGLVFSSYDLSFLDSKNKELLEYYLSSGTYGTVENLTKNKLNDLKSDDKKFLRLRYVFRRFFPPMEIYRVWFPFFYKHKILLPVGWLYRLIRAPFYTRKKIKSEIKELKRNNKA